MAKLTGENLRLSGQRAWKWKVGGIVGAPSQAQVCKKIGKAYSLLQKPPDLNFLMGVFGVDWGVVVTLLSQHVYESTGDSVMPIVLLMNSDNFAIYIHTCTKWSKVGDDCCFLVAVHMRIGLLRASDPGDRQLPKRAGVRCVLWVGDSARQLGVLPASLQHVVPRLPQRVPEQRHFHWLMFVRQHFQSRPRRQLLHPRGPGPR
jgi:hypothetical protein